MSLTMRTLPSGASARATDAVPPKAVKAVPSSIAATALRREKGGVLDTVSICALASWEWQSSYCIIDGTARIYRGEFLARPVALAGLVDLIEYRDDGGAVVGGDGLVGLQHRRG